MEVFCLLFVHFPNDVKDYLCFKLLLSGS
jgi:hypothetical protein